MGQALDLQKYNARHLNAVAATVELVNEGYVRFSKRYEIATAVLDLIVKRLAEDDEAVS